MLVTELWTPIYDGSIWKAPVFPAEITNLRHSQHMLRIDGLVNSDLAAVVRNIQYTTILLNRHYYEQTPIDGVLLQECLGFVHSILTKLEGRLEDELSECLRLGMMVFFATTFRLPGLYEHPCCKSLASRLQLSYAATKVAIPNLHATIDIWLMLVCLISTDDMDELYIWASWEALAKRGLSWSETRRELKQVMWVDAFHDDLGKRAFETFMIRCGPSSVSKCDGILL